MKKTSFDRTKTMSVASVAATAINTGLSVRGLQSVYDELKSQLETTDKKGWKKHGLRMLSFIKDYQASLLAGDSVIVPPFKVYAKGNSKLPFFSFASLPVVLCAGAGDCVNWCYSLKAWRYPAAFFRQLQNSLLLGHALGREELSKATSRLPQGVTVRLYTDGDFSSVQDVIFWGNMLRKRPDLQAYGYSKSFTELLAAYDNGHTMPSNYVLNISNGSNASQATLERAKELPFTRGSFVAVNAEKGATAGAMVQAYKASTGKKAFVCPSKCGECTSVGHACGNKSTFDNVDIIIAIH